MAGLLRTHLEMTKDNSYDDALVRSHRSNNNDRRSRRSRRGRKGDEGLHEMTGTTDAQFVEDEDDVQTHRQRAMAIITCMIRVAVGLACAENILLRQPRLDILKKMNAISMKRSRATLSW
jgi:hypothetical protein